MIAYNNAKSFFEESMMKFTTSLDEFTKDNIVKYVCESGHENILKRSTFANKRKTTSVDDFCAKCFIETDEEMIEKYNQKLENKNGHKVIQITNRDKREVLFICGNCEQEGKSNQPSLEKNIGYCKKCEHDSNKKDTNKIIEIIQKLQMKLDPNYPFEYKNRNTKNIYVICRCGDKYVTSGQILDRGSNCKKCMPTKVKETVQEKYHVDNVFQLEEVKEKIKGTNKEKLGVEYPQQSETVVKKTQETNMEKYGYKYAFNQPEVYEKLQKICLEKYGSKFPLQNDEIKQKCIDTCKNNHGVKYPMQSPILLQKIIENSIKTCLEKYGVHYPFLNEEIFNKAVSKLGQRKPFQLGDKTVYVMGYEPQMIKILLKKLSPDTILVGKDANTYFYKTDDQIIHKYYPDIEIKNKNITIEVKSIWTFNLQPRKNFLKMQALVENNRVGKMYIFKNKTSLYDIWIFDKDGIKSRNYPDKKDFDKPIDESVEISCEDIEEMIVEDFIENFIN